MERAALRAIRLPRSFAGKSAAFRPAFAFRGFAADTHLLWRGVQSTSFSELLEFKDGSESTFPVFQVLNSQGKLQDGVELPFSLDEGVHMMELMVKSKVYDDVLLTMQRQGRISFYCTNYGEEARLGPWDPMPGGWLEKLFKGSLGFRFLGI
ncbi:unnamed protein product [Effrenium voratum]|nr:unnamed protein product [Effrenium voratum]